MEPILEVTGLYKRYPGFALEQVSFSVRPGTVMGLIGRNGAGKTTTIRSILRLVHPDAGTVRLLGQNIAENERALRQALGYAAGGTVCYPRKRVGEIAAVTARFFENWDEGRYQSLLERFALDPGKRLTELSEGMKRKFSLALAMSHHARHAGHRGAPQPASAPQRVQDHGRRRADHAGICGRDRRRHLHDGRSLRCAGSNIRRQALSFFLFVPSSTVKNP